LTTLLRDIISNIEALGGTAILDKRTRVLTINHEFAVAVGIAWNAGQEAARPRWRVTFAKTPASELYLIIRLEASNVAIQDYYLVPSAGTDRTKLRTIISNPTFGEPYRRGNLDAFFSLCGREEFKEAA